MGDRDDLFLKQDFFLTPMPNEDKIRDVAELDRIKIREAMQIEPLKIEPISFSVDISDGQDWETILGIGTENGRTNVCSLVIEGEPKVNKPKNLKYPNKKRKRRILKKWAKRFGVTPNQIVFPEAEVESFLAPNEDGILCWHFAVKPKKQK